MYIDMGQTAENLALLKGVTRAEMDEFAVRSHTLAEKATADGFFAREITPVTLPDGTVIATDDCPRPGVTLDGVASLKPVFRADGRVTAGNACPLNDGAAALIIMSDTKARDLGIDPDTLNVHGGAIALGHPFGMSGARITGTLINGLRSTDGTLGLETMCVGGGMGMAMIIERLS